jgi:uncharacterized membrane protein
MKDSDRAPAIHYGGSIEQTLAGNAQLDVLAVLREAWALTEGAKGMIIGGGLLVYATALVALTLLNRLVGGEDPSLLGGIVPQLAAMAIVNPYLAGVFMLGLRRSVGMPVDFQSQFAYYSLMLPILGVAVLQSAVTSLGFLLLILPGLYFSIALCLALPLKVERDLSIIECLLTSVRLVNRKFFEVATLSIIAVGLAVLGVVSVIGWIWTLPWMVMIFAVIYRQLVGYRSGGATGGVLF